MQKTKLIQNLFFCTTSNFLSTELKDTSQISVSIPGVRRPHPNCKATPVYISTFLQWRKMEDKNNKKYPC